MPSRERARDECKHCRKPIVKIRGDWVHDSGYSIYCEPPKKAEPRGYVWRNPQGLEYIPR